MPMANDHFVAQTYLKHWNDPKTEMLYGYSKAVDKEFPCRTKDVCREWNWDVNPRFKDNPGLLADFRKMFEPHWKPTVGAIRSGPLSSHEKFALAGYWAQLTTCTPAWHRNAIELYEKQLVDFIPLVAKHVADKFPEHREYIAKAVAEGRIKPNVDGDYVKGILTAHLTEATIVLYEQDWIVIKNQTEVPFITSDNPSCVFPHRPMGAPLIRFLPLAPDLAILAVIDRRKLRNESTPPDLSKPTPGIIRRAFATRKRVAKFNRIIAMNADELILCSKKDHHVRRWVHNHRKFSVAVDHVKIPSPDGGHISGSTLVVRQKT